MFAVRSDEGQVAEAPLAAATRAITVLDASPSAAAGQELALGVTCLHCRTTVDALMDSMSTPYVYAEAAM
jgi:hypothetical protein